MKLCEEVKKLEKRAKFQSDEQTTGQRQTAPETEILSVFGIRGIYIIGFNVSALLTWLLFWGFTF